MNYINSTKSNSEMGYCHKPKELPIYSVVIPMVCAFGLAGNIMSIVVLSQKRFRKDNIMFAYLKVFFFRINDCVQFREKIILFFFKVNGGG